MNLNSLEELGLARNEGFIYFSLVKFGTLGVASIALKAGVHRRNVYDSIQRLIERGLVYEEVGGKENLYHATDPNKLLEMAEEKRAKVEAVVPDLLRLFKSSAPDESVAVYRGVEGVKNYLRHIERERKPVCMYGAQGASLSPKVSYVFNQCVRTLEQKHIPIRVLYRAKAAQEHPEIVGHLGKTSANRILPERYNDPATYTVFGDYVYFESGQYTRKNIEDNEEITQFMIKSKEIADLMRNSYEAVWRESHEIKGKK